jgi:hypothetical protein
MIAGRLQYDEQDALEKGNGGASADVSLSQSHKAREFRDGVASADVSRRHGRRLLDAPP